MLNQTISQKAQKDYSLDANFWQLLEQEVQVAEASIPVKNTTQGLDFQWSFNLCNGSMNGSQRARFR